jgi:hypothetical protein
MRVGKSYMKNLRKQFTYRNGRIVTSGDIWLNKEALETLEWWENAIIHAKEGDGHKTSWDQFWTKAPSYIASWSDASGLGGFGLIMEGEVMQGHFHREKFVAHESSCAWELLPLLAAARLWGPTKLRGKVWLAITDSANNARALNKGVAKGQSYIELMKALQELCAKYSINILGLWAPRSDLQLLDDLSKDVIPGTEIQSPRSIHARPTGKDCSAH